MTFKYIGNDSELSTTGIDPDGRSINPWDVTKAILRHIDVAFQPYDTTTWSSYTGLSYTGSSSTGRSGTHGGQSSYTTYGYGGNGGYGGYGWQGSPYSIDCLRRWAPNGQCFYADMSHVEACHAACLQPRTYAAQSVAVMMVAERARRAAEEAADDGTRYSLSAANVDVLDPGISWGTHVNVTISRELWEDLCLEHLHPARLGLVASGLAAAIPFFGAGYLLPFKDGSTILSLSARAHHLSCLKSLSTTEAYRRGLINTRREAHGDEHERMHLIGFDNTPLNAALKCTFLQTLFAAAEEGFCGLNLYDPIRAVRRWSWNLDLNRGALPATAMLVDGRSMTLPAYVRELSMALLQMCESGLITDQVAPQAPDNLARIIELTHYLERGELVRCARHLDWAAKLLCLIDVCQRENVPLGHAKTRLADHDFANTDPRRGDFWRLWESGHIDPLITLEDAEQCLVDGPPESRDWGRGRLIRKFAQHISDVDWSYIELQESASRWGRRRRIEFPRMDSLNRAQFEPLLDQVNNLDELVQAMDKCNPQSSAERDPEIDIRSQLAVPDDVLNESGGSTVN